MKEWMGAVMALGSVFLPAVSFAEVIQLQVQLPAPELWQDGQGFTHVELKGFVNLDQPGKPALPGRAVMVPLPPGHSVESVELLPSEEIELPGTHVVFPAQKPWPLSFQGPRPFTPADAQLYQGGGVWPPEMGSASALQSLRGFSLLPVIIHPVRYRPQSGVLSYFPSVILSVRTVPDPGLVDRDQAGYRGFARDFQRVRPLVARPEILERYPLNKNFLLQADRRYLIITNQALAGCSAPNNLQALASDKQSRGIGTYLETLENIRSAYTGRDDAEKVRNFIKDMYQSHGTDFVLIAGDADLQQVGGETQAPIVPVRGLWGDIGYGVENNIPSDLYYACLDGSFNADGDSLWGEADDDVDLLAEVWVGRAAVDNCTEVSNFVRKTLAYQNGSGTWLQKVYMVGEWLWEAEPSYAKDYLQHVHYSSTAEGIDTKGFSESSYFQVSTMYDKDLGGPNSWGPPEILSILNGGTHIINHLGHSYTYYNMRLLTDDIDSGMSNTLPFFVYTQGCYPGAFDNRLDPQENNRVYWQDSFSEHMVLGSRGAFAVVMNTRYGLGGYSNYFHRYFWDAAFRNGLSRLGEMHAYSREPLSGWIYDTGIRWVYYEVTLFGDPELSIHLGAQAQNPMIGLPTDPVWFLAIEGGDNPKDQTITIRNDGSGSLNWTVSCDQNWLTATPAAGTAPTDIVLSANSTGMPVGDYTANLTFTAPLATNSPQVLPIYFFVINVPSTVAPFTASAPNVDGTIGVTEYAGAAVLDMDPNRPGTSTARVMHDGSRLYFALEVGADTDVDDNDALLVLFDNNNNDLWPAAGGDEGLFEIFPGGYGVFAPAYNAGAGVVYGSWEEYPAGVTSAFGTGASPRVMEVSFDLTQSHLKRLPGESFGMFLFFYDYLQSQNDFDAVAYWPWAIDSYDACLYFGDVTVGTTVDSLTANPASLSFNGLQGGPPTAKTSLTIGSTTSASLGFTLVAQDSWIKLSKVSGTTPDIVGVWADPTGLASGIRNGRIEIRSPSASNSPLAVPVSFEVAPPPPAFGLSPEFIFFEASQGGPLPSAQTLNISNLGAGTLDWTATKEGDWFALSSSSGRAPSTITIVPLTTALPPGFHAGALRLTAPGAEAARVEVSYTVKVPPTLSVTPDRIDREDARAAGKVDVELLVNNEQLGSMDWYLGEDCPWISVNPTSGMAVTGHPSRVTVTLDPAGMSVGLHQANLTVTAPGASGSPKTIPVNWTLVDRPAISVSPASLDFEAGVGGPNPPAQTLSIGNAGPGTMSWVVTCRAAWLSCNPGSGVAPGNLSASVDVAGLSEGLYTSAITVSSPEAANSPVEVRVSLVVSIVPPNRPPPAPELVNPTDQAEIDTTRPELVVQSVADPDGDQVTYTFEVYELGYSIPVLVMDDVPAGSGYTYVRLGASLTDGIAYQWRARAVDQKGLAGDWSGFWEFTVRAGGGGCGCGASGSSPVGSLFLLGLGLTLGLARSRSRSGS